MTRWTFRSISALVVALAVLAIGVTSASALVLTPTSAPLPGSNAQAGDGDQDNPGTDVGGGPLPMGTTDGHIDFDWQQVPNSPGGGDSVIPGDQAFAGGDKETEPGLWGLQYEGTGVNPSKDNLLAAWSASSGSVSGPPSTFFYMAFTREAQTGNTFITFELNQLRKSWDNGISTIPCRTDGDLLVVYNVESGGSPPNVDVIVYEWHTGTNPGDFEVVDGVKCARNGTPEPIDPQPYAEAGINAREIDNYLVNGGFGNKFAEGTFGEAGLNLTGILASFGSDLCTDFGQVGMHTRSSTSVDSQLQDFFTPVPIQTRSCKLKIDKKVSVDDPSGTYVDGPTTAHVGDTLYYKLVVSNTGSQTLNVTTTDFSSSCGGVDGIFATPTGDTPVTMPQSIAGGTSATYYCRHLVTSGDAAAGDYVNTACTEGETPGGDKATGDPNAAALCDTVTVHVFDPHLKIVKTQGLAADGSDLRDSRFDVHLNDVVHYKLLVTNTGNVALDVTTLDPPLGDTGCDGPLQTTLAGGTDSPQPDPLAAGASATYYCDHTIVDADGDAFTNHACTDGVDSKGTHATPKTGDSLCDDVTVDILKPHLKVDKTQSLDSSGTTYQDGDLDANPGDIVYYKVVATNTGNTGLSVNAHDVNCGGKLYDSVGGAEVSFPISLAKGDSATFYCQHALTTADNGDYTNEACVDGTDRTGEAAVALNGDKLCDTVTTHVLDPHLKLDKKISPTAGSGYTDGPINAYIGDTLYYEIVVTNTGNVDLAVTTVDDNDHCDAIVDAAVGGNPVTMPEQIAAGESKTYYCQHTLTTSDTLDPGNTWTNTACTSGKDRTEMVATAKPGDVLCDSTTATIKTSSISGQKFHDLNADGNRDAGEPVLDSWTIYIDENDSNSRDPGEPFRVTDANGDYQFSGLNPGNYILREDMTNHSSDWHCSSPLASGPSAVCEFHVTLGKNDEANRDFGNWRENTVSGVKFHDLDADGNAREAGESGLEGWTFYVDYNANGAQDSGEPAAVSAADGSWKIGGIKPGTFAVREVSQSGWTCSFPATCEYDLTFRSSDDYTDKDFGNWEPASVSGTKFQDSNGSGARDADEGPLSGFTFYADYNANGALDSGEPAAVSGSDGSYVITGIKPGSWTIREVTDPNFTCTAPGSGDACKHDVKLNAGESAAGQDFGNQPPAQLVLPERITPGTARLLGPTGCQARTFSARVRGTKVASVVFVLDGKTVKRMTKPNSGTQFALRVNPARMRIGVHRLVVSVTFQKGTGTKPKKFRLSFQRCAKKLAAPRFTG